MKHIFSCLSQFTSESTICLLAKYIFKYFQIFIYFFAMCPKLNVSEMNIYITKSGNWKEAEQEKE